MGSRPNGVYVPRFRSVSSKHPDFIRGYGFRGGAGRSGWQGRARSAGIGAEFKNRLAALGPWSLSFGGFGEMLQSVFNGLETTQANADAAVQGLALGDPVDIHDVMLATETEALAFQLALQVRNHLVETVKTVFNMQV